MRDLIEEFNQQMPEGLVANLEQAGMFDEDYEDELKEAEDDDGSSESGTPIIH